ncbi:RHS repeat-associated core domain-containing protein [Chryseobacterium sp. RLHN22]|uniref:RHS repeat-associated core domain-containing protein n=1 Tax=Chryseobacterium sp. RLHN22 TaxID=3437885 RepID=UPI003D9B82A6
MKKIFILLIIGVFNIVLAQNSYIANFHDTKGNIEVNQGGQLQFTLHIDLPKGLKEVSPNISLVYQSNSGNGLAGYNWNISGVTSILRTGKTIEKDGELKAIQLDDSDYYSFNGQRLILKSGTYGGDGAEYVTEQYSNIKIKSLGSFNPIYVQMKGPVAFEVTFEDGSTASYGSYQYTGSQSLYNATTPSEYNITRWRDAQGNTIYYKYIQNGNVAVLSSIQWGGNDVINKPNLNEIIFDYVDRNLNEQSHVGGISFSQTKILKDITVKSNNLQYKKYVITHSNNPSGYQLISSITEYNSSNEPANPVSFTYTTPSSAQIDYYGVLSNNPDSFDDIKFSGDFNGDSYVDFLMSNGVLKLGAFNDNYSNINTNKIFDSRAQMVNTLLDENGEIYNGNGIIEYENGKINGYIFRNNTFEKVFEKSVLESAYCPECNVTNYKIQELDIDGDGISNLITTLDYDCPSVVEPPVITPCPDPNNPLKPCLDPNPTDPGAGLKSKPGLGDLVCIDHSRKFIVDLKDPNIPIIEYAELGITPENTSNEKFLDVDGDGKVESINVSNSAYTVFEFVKTGANSYIKQVKYSANLAEPKDPDFPVLFGDFNGDNNVDFAIPTTNNQNADNWRFYMGTDIGFQNILKTNFLLYRKPGQENTWSLINHHFYSVSDVNKDGKSDIVFVHSKNKVGGVSNSGNALWRSLQYDVKTLQSKGGTEFINAFNSTSPSYTVGGGEYGLFQPLIYPIKSNNNYYDIFIFKNTRVHKYKAQTSLAELSQIRSIYQAGLTTNIIYKELNSDTDSYFYLKTKPETYPYFSLKRVDKSFAVSQLQQGNRKQDFLYRGMTGHMIGRGTLGFLKTARSNWYADGFENTIIWTGQEINPQNFGLPVKDWSIKTSSKSNVFPQDLSVNNNQLLSLKLTQYSHQQLGNNVHVILPNIITEKDFLKNITSVSTITYGNYYLPVFTEVNINNSFAKKISELHYIHNPGGIGSNYFVGRPDWKEDIIYAYNDTAKSKEVYSYNNNLLQSLTKFNKDYSGWIKEQYQYDNVGNITKKTTTNSADGQTTIIEDEYDSSLRFVLKKKDNLELETYFTYDNWGRILTQTDPFGNTSTNVYDNWGKLTSNTNDLGGTTTYNFEKFEIQGISGTKITENLPTGDIKVGFTNVLGQNYKNIIKSFNHGNYTVKESSFDVLGRKTAECEPYEVTSISPEPTNINSSTWNIISYDDSVFPAKVTAHAFNNGKVLQTSITGNTESIVEINGYGRTTSKTTDALGNVISSTDAGGTITFSYNAVSQNISANYQGNSVTIIYDVWGRKSTFNDPANGTYTYSYDGFGSIKKIKSPKGEKNFTYNSKGLLNHITEISNDGISTNKNIELAYNSKGQLISKQGESNNKFFTHTYEYYPNGRLKNDIENFDEKYFFTEDISYDNIGRIQSYHKGINSNGDLTKVTVDNIYSTWNGEMRQQKDHASGVVLWQLGTTNAKGLITQENLGGARIYNTYDAFGFLTNTNRYFHPTLQGQPSLSFVNIDYSFNAIKNELNSRTYNAVFNIQETFSYDNNNRLTNWTNPINNQMSYNDYDIKGRIMHNDQVGDVDFAGNSQYQATKVNLNQQGQDNYQINGVSKLLQMISYNENNDPLKVDGTEFDYEFGYGLTQSRQLMYYGQNFDGSEHARFTKYYSEGNDFEIIKNNESGQEKHIIYIGGSPYESEIIYIKSFEGGKAYNFLHKDYLGSILAITDGNKNVLEQRHYDAWGRFTHLKTNGNILVSESGLEDYLKETSLNEGGLIIDRGYTSHEHLYGVELIHMNGRLYDPLLRRFLNADENIQDPFNTQNYNKYGYVMNNPLMYNDPSGEMWFATPFLVYVMLTVKAAVIGAAIGAGVYIIQAAINNNFSWSGFTRSILTGAITGAVSGGLGQVFSASGFWATVGNGALVGAGTGGVSSLINGTNFLEGLTKGAVIGGAVAGASWGINKFFSKPDISQDHYLPDNTNGDIPYDPVNKEYISKYYEDNLNDADKLKLKNAGYKKVYFNKGNAKTFAPSGWKVDSDGRFVGDIKGKTIEALGITRDGRVFLSPKALSNKKLFAFVLHHEYGHVMLDDVDEWINIAFVGNDFASHIPISNLENEFVKINGLSNLNFISRQVNNELINVFKQQPMYQRWYEKIKFLAKKVKF